MLIKVGEHYHRYTDNEHMGYAVIYTGANRFTCVAMFVHREHAEEYAKSHVNFTVYEISHSF